MSPAYFLDTNILLYALSLAEDHLSKQPTALQWLRRGDWGVSTQVLMEFYGNIKKPRHAVSPSIATGMVQDIVEERPVQSIDTELVIQALALAARYQISHWDAAIVCAAGRLGAHTVISEDLGHGQVYANVRVLNPFVGDAA